MRRRTLLLVLIAALVLGACANPLTEDDVRLIVAEELPAPVMVEEPAAPEPPPEPAWVPEVWHVYVFDHTEAIIADEYACPADVYRSRYTAWAYTVEMHNLLDDPAHPWRLVGGGVE